MSSNRQKYIIYIVIPVMLFWLTNCPSMRDRCYSNYATDGNPEPMCVAAAVLYDGCIEGSIAEGLNPDNCNLLITLCLSIIEQSKRCDKEPDFIPYPLPN